MHLVSKRDSYFGRLLGSESNSKGGYARAKSLSAGRRSEIAQKAAQARWSERARRKTDIKDPSASINKLIVFGM